MENISPELRAEIPEFKSGAYRFRLLGLKMNLASNTLQVPAKRGILPEDTIFDPYWNNNKGRMVTIECVDKLLNTNADSKKEYDKVLRKIAFTSQDDGGEMVLYGERKENKALFEYLWLCNYNASNKGKPWHIKPTQYEYEFIDFERISKDKNTFRRRKHTAEGIALDTPVTELRVICEQLSKVAGSGFIFSSDMSEAQMRSQLLALAEKEPERIVVLDKEINMEIHVAIKEAINLGVIIVDEPKKQIIWSNKKMLVLLRDEVGPEDTLVYHFLSKEGSEDMRLMLIQVEERQKNEDISSSSNGSGNGSVNGVVVTLEEAQEKYRKVFGKEPHPKATNVEKMLEKIRVKENSLQEA